MGRCPGHTRLQGRRELADPNFIARPDGVATPLPSPFLRQWLPPLLYNLFSKQQRFTRAYYPREMLSLLKHWFLSPALQGFKKLKS
jgi:hypothetical protein